MKDYKDRFEKLLTDAADCELIGSLAVDETKRATFRRLAKHFRAVGEQLKAEMEGGRAAFPPISNQEFLLLNAKDFRDLAATCGEEAIRAELLRMAADFEQKAAEAGRPPRVTASAGG
jgi:hypothetical protein